MYWYGASGQILKETDLAGNNPKDYIFFNGDRIARRDSATVIHYYFSDHLGSSNVMTNKTGLTIEEESDFYPFGGERVINDTLADQNYKFTGKERDPETNLDYFGARYYAFNFGRFTVADAPFADQHAFDPQSWNLYAYARNNPLKYTDPTGKFSVAIWGDCAGNEVCERFRSYASSLPADCTYMCAEAQGDSDNDSDEDENHKAKQALDLFNATLGFGETDCAQGGDCFNAVGMAFTAIVAAAASGGASESAFVERQIATASKRIENIATRNLTRETLEQAYREVTGGMKIFKADGAFFDHVGKVERAIAGLEKQVRHLEKIMKRSGLTETQTNTLSGLVKKAGRLICTAREAITPKEPM